MSKLVPGCIQDRVISISVAPSLKTGTGADPRANAYTAATAPLSRQAPPGQDFRFMCQKIGWPGVMISRSGVTYVGVAKMAARVKQVTGSQLIGWTR